MEQLTSKNTDIWLARVGAGIYMMVIIGFGILASRQEYYYGSTNKFGGSIVSLEGVQALLIIWSLVFLFATVITPVFPKRQHALIWLAMTLGGGFGFLVLFFLTR